MLAFESPCDGRAFRHAAARAALTVPNFHATVCAGGVTSAARRERRIAEPAQQAAWSARKSAI